MRSKRSRLGIVIIFLLVILPIYLFFNHAGAKTKEAVPKSVVQKTETVLSEKDKKEPAPEMAETTATPKEEPAVEEIKIETPEKVAHDTETTETTGADEQTIVQQDFLVVIDPGHQERANLEKEPVGPGAREMKIKVSGGTSGVATGKPEYQLTLEASLILGEILEKNGVKVIYTRTAHNVNISNRERAEIANQHQADLLIRIHADGAENQSVSGLSVLTPANDNPYTKAIYDDSLKASQFIMDEVKRSGGIKVNGISFRGDLSGFNWSKVPTTLIELGFMTNPDEDKKLSDPAYITSLMTKIAEGTLQYANHKQ